MYNIVNGVFAINMKDGLDECKRSWEMFKEVKELNSLGMGKYDDHVADGGAILVATKCDLYYDDFDEQCKKAQQIMRRNRENAMKLSKLWNVPYIETSAKRDINVHFLFERIIYEYWVQSQLGDTVNWNEKDC